MYTPPMNTRTAVVWGVIFIVVLIGAYFAYTMIADPSDATNQAASTTGATLNATSTEDRVQAQEVTIGTGEEAKSGMKVSVLYVGQFQDGTVFDSSAAHGNQPLEFILGEGGIIPGFQFGVNGMKVGGERVLQIPPSLGYGDQPVRENQADPNSKIIIPANSTLVFDIKLVAVESVVTSTDR